MPSSQSQVVQRVLIRHHRYPPKPRLNAPRRAIHPAPPSRHRPLKRAMASPAIAEVMRRIQTDDVAWGSVFTDKMLLMRWNVKTGWSAPRVEPYAPLQLPPSSSIFHYGMEVFEGLKAYKTRTSANAQVRLFRPQLNIARLNHSARRLALPTVDETAFLRALTAFVHLQTDWVPSTPGASLYIRPCIIATDARIGVRRSDSALLYVIASPVSSFFKTSGPASGPCQKGIKLLANPHYVRAWKGGVGDCKTGANYATSIAPTEAAVAQGYDQVLWLSDAQDRLVTEVGMMNIFFVFRDSPSAETRLVTPALDGTILNGVTRRSVLQLAQEMGMRAEERQIGVDEVCEAVNAGTIVEIFGTGTGAIICPVYSITVDEKTVCVKSHEEPLDTSVMFRNKLTAIQTSDEAHPWMVSVDSPTNGKHEPLGEHCTNGGSH